MKKKSILFYEISGIRKRAKITKILARKFFVYQQLAVKSNDIKKETITKLNKKQKQGSPAWEP